MVGGDLRSLVHFVCTAPGTRTTMVASSSQCPSNVPNSPTFQMRIYSIYCGLLNVAIISISRDSTLIIHFRKGS